jgi:O-antigen ligase
VKILAEQGTIGMFIFLLMFLLALRSGWRLYRDTEDPFLKGLGLGFFTCVIATMTTNVFGDRWTYVQLGAYYWVFLALVVRSNIMIKEEIPAGAK